MSSKQLPETRKGFFASSSLGRMLSVPDSSAGPASQGVASEYDSFAEAYTAETEANVINGYYMRPAIMNLAGDVGGRRILHAGCGSGPIAAALRDRGATVTGGLAGGAVDGVDPAGEPDRVSAVSGGSELLFRAVEVVAGGEFEDGSG